MIENLKNNVRSLKIFGDMSVKGKVQYNKDYLRKLLRSTQDNIKALRLLVEKENDNKNIILIISDCHNSHRHCPVNRSYL